MPDIANTPTQLLPANATADELLHGLSILGIMLAALFIKNPNSQQHAAGVINTMNQVVLPLADQILLGPTAAAPPVTIPIK